MKKVDVDFAGKKATVETASGEATPDKLLEALGKAGYKGKIE